jgi:excisionase family DNA binding protein
MGAKTQHGDGITSYNAGSTDRPIIGLDEPLLTVQEAADYLRLSKSFLDKLRVYGGGPTFQRLGRAIRYLKSDLHAWAAQRRFGSTSEYDH